MGCGASAAAGSAYGAPAEPKVAREPLSEEQLQQLQQRVVRRMIGQALLAAWGSWLAFHKVRGPELAKERAAKRVLSKLRNLPFVQCKPSPPRPVPIDRSISR
jgi:hypothetical protein